MSTTCIRGTLLGGLLRECENLLWNRWVVCSTTRNSPWRLCQSAVWRFCAGFHENHCNRSMCINHFLQQCFFISELCIWFNKIYEFRVHPSKIYLALKFFKGKSDIWFCQFLHMMVLSLCCFNFVHDNDHNNLRLRVHAKVEVTTRILWHLMGFHLIFCDILCQ